MAYRLLERQLINCGLDGVSAVDSSHCSCIIQAYGSCTAGISTQRLACLCPSLANWASQVEECVITDPSRVAYGASQILSYLSPSCSALTAPKTTTAIATRSSTLSVTASTISTTSSALFSTTGTSTSSASSLTSQSSVQQSGVGVSTAAPSSTTSSTHSPLPPWNGFGPLLAGYCVTPQYTLFDGTTALWAPVVGCVDGKPDCCPFTVQTTTTTVTDVVTTVTINVGSSTQSSQGQQLEPMAFPAPSDPAQATLAKCPQDYQSISDGCCPSCGYQLWDTTLGGETPCFSTLQVALTPPPIPPPISVSSPTSAAGSTTTALKPTLAVVNVVYAMHFPVSPDSSQLSTPAKIGIGTGLAVAGLVIASLLAFLFWSRRRHWRELQRQRELLANGPGEAEPGRNGTAAPLPAMVSFSPASPIGSSGNGDMRYGQPQSQPYIVPSLTSYSGFMTPPSGTEGLMPTNSPHQRLDPN